MDDGQLMKGLLLGRVFETDNGRQYRMDGGHLMTRHSAKGDWIRAWNRKPWTDVTDDVGAACDGGVEAERFQ